MGSLKGKLNAFKRWPPPSHFSAFCFPAGFSFPNATGQLWTDGCGRQPTGRPAGRDLCWKDVQDGSVGDPADFHEDRRGGRVLVRRHCEFVAAFGRARTKPAASKKHQHKLNKPQCSNQSLQASWGVLLFCFYFWLWCKWIGNESE